MTQNESILQHLVDWGSITPLDAFKVCGCLRLSERIRELEAGGVQIHHEMVKVGNKRVCRYTISRLVNV